MNRIRKYTTDGFVSIGRAIVIGFGLIGMVAVFPFIGFIMAMGFIFAPHMVYDEYGLLWAIFYTCFALFTTAIIVGFVKSKNIKF